MENGGLNKADGRVIARFLAAQDAADPTAAVRGRVTIARTVDPATSARKVAA